MYIETSNEVEVVAASNVSHIPNELCFQLVYGTSMADFEEAVGAPCVGVGERIELKTGRTTNEAYLVSYGKNVFSEPSSLSTQNPKPSSGSSPIGKFSGQHAISRMFKTGIKQDSSSSKSMNEDAYVHC